MWTMCWMNFWCGLYNCAYLFIISPAGFQLLAFCRAHPDATWDILLFCLCGAVGQLFIFFTIRTFGSLVNTLITTTRKFFNILLSVVWNGNPLLPQQWVAVFLVFAGLLVSSVTKGRKHSKGPAATPVGKNGLGGNVRHIKAKAT
jgi:UDP-galactose transporter B1